MVLTTKENFHFNGQRGKLHVIMCYKKDIEQRTNKKKSAKSWKKLEKKQEKAEQKKVLTARKCKQKKETKCRKVPT